MSGGEGPTSYDWEYRPLGSFSWQDKYCTGESCSHTYYSNSEQVQTGGMRAIVTKGSETDTASTIVSVPPSCGDNVLICPETATADARSVAVRSFSAQQAGAETATLRWTTSRTLPAPEFTVQHRTDSTETWTDLGVVEAADSMAKSTPAPGARYQFAAEGLAVGPHQFRLAVEADRKAGRTWTSEPVTARVELEDAYRLSAYPNPMRQRATVELAVQEAQEVTVRVYDVLGRAVTTLHQEPVPAQETTRFRIDAPQTGLSSGTYFLRVRGEGFVATDPLTVVR